MKNEGKGEKASFYAKATTDKKGKSKKGAKAQKHKGTKFSPLPLVGEGPGVRAK